MATETVAGTSLSNVMAFKTPVGTMSTGPTATSRRGQDDRNEYDLPLVRLLYTPFLGQAD